MTQPVPHPHPAPGEVWHAPLATGPINAHIYLPGSKSLTNRLLVMAALSQRPVTVSGVLDSRDTTLMMDALTQLGATFTGTEQARQFEVTPIDLQAPGREITIDCGLAGTVMRFVPPVAALTRHTVHFTGDAEALIRPMGPVVDGLVQAGATITSSDQDTESIEYLPFTVHGSGQLSGGTVAVNASGSSQFISALLLIGAHCQQRLALKHTGDHVPSPEHIRMTTDLLNTANITVSQPEERRWEIQPQTLQLPDAVVEPDLSNAGPYLAAAVLTGGRVSVPFWPAETTQIGDRWREILPAFGADVEFEPVPHTEYGTLTVTGTSANGAPVVTGAGEVADTAELAPTVCALALLADGPTTVSGIGHLRGHETDRLHAITQEAKKLGVDIEEGQDYLNFPATTPTQPAELDSYADHRMATFGAIIGLRVPGVRVIDVATTAKTMPDFPRAWIDVVGSAAANDSSESNEPLEVQA